jgi:glycerol kinase
MKITTAATCETGRVSFVAAIDQGTTSSRCIVFDSAGRIVAADQREHRQIFPKPGWVEHDPVEIWDNVRSCVQNALQRAGIARTTWPPSASPTSARRPCCGTGAPANRCTTPIVWQDTRTDALVAALAARTGWTGSGRHRTAARHLLLRPEGPVACSTPIRAAPAGRGGRDPLRHHGLVADLEPHRSAHHRRHQRQPHHADEPVHVDWDDRLCEAIGVPRPMLPEIRPSSDGYGEARGPLHGVPVAGALGDQQAALFGQTCFEPGEAKCTYGTGAFLLQNTGTTATLSRAGLVTTVAYQRAGEAPVYALEGSIAVAGSLVQWLRDNLGLIATASDMDSLAGSVGDTGGAVIVPAFSGLFAPHWRSDARGVIVGLTGYVTKAHLARAALEATAWQVREVVDAMAADAGLPLAELKVDGGMTASPILPQLQADVLNVPVVRPEIAETTCLGAAYAAGLAVGFWPDLAALRANWRADRTWRPAMSDADRETRLPTAGARPSPAPWTGCEAKRPGRRRLTEERSDEGAESTRAGGASPGPGAARAQRAPEAQWAAHRCAAHRYLEGEPSPTARRP